ncbi:MAG TPA: hypothetical protein VJQ45_09140 [Ktedonobacterales bacterium]|nr:hypothetical protein [Ktedonobacterales bacterium]
MNTPPDNGAPRWPDSTYSPGYSAGPAPHYPPTAAYPPPPPYYPPSYVPYGYPLPYFQPPVADPGSGAAVASLILGIVSAFVTFLVFVPCLPLIGLGAAVAGIITGALGLKSTTRHGMAVAGVVTSVIALALGVGLIAGYIILDAIMLSGMPAPA